MPATSRAQQRYFGLLHSIQRGKSHATDPKLRNMALRIDPQDVTDFASTKHKGLPERAPGDEKQAAGFGDAMRWLGRQATRPVAPGWQSAIDRVHANPAAGNLQHLMSEFTPRRVGWGTGGVAAGMIEYNKLNRPADAEAASDAFYHQPGFSASPETDRGAALAAFHESHPSHYWHPPTAAAPPPPPAAPPGPAADSGLGAKLHGLFDHGRDAVSSYGHQLAGGNPAAWAVTAGVPLAALAMYRLHQSRQNRRRQRDGGDDYYEKLSGDDPVARVAVKTAAALRHNANNLLAAGAEQLAAAHPGFAKAARHVRVLGRDPYEAVKAAFPNHPAPGRLYNLIVKAAAGLAAKLANMDVSPAGPGGGGGSMATANTTTPPTVSPTSYTGSPAGAAGFMAGL